MGDHRSTDVRRAALPSRLASVIRVSALRVGMLVVVSAIVWAILGSFVEGDSLGQFAPILFIAGFVLIVAGVLLGFVSPLDRGPSLLVDSPVEGRWQALNGPASKVPSHGTHAYGQAYAVDLVYLPDGVDHPEFGKAGASVLPPERFPAFGQPIRSATSGVVVAASDRLRDHGSRSSWTSLLWFMLVEGSVREFAGPGRVVGNHVIVRNDDGTHLVYAHLKQGSIRVRAGARVQAGAQLAECGNTGNSTEPHLHIHRQDVADLQFATGLPWGIRGAAADGADGFPVNGQVFVGHPGR